MKKTGWLVLAGVLFALVCINLAGLIVDQAKSKPEEPVAQPSAPAAQQSDLRADVEKKLKDKCNQELDGLIADGRRLMAAKNPDEAATRLAPCVGLTDSKELEAIYDKAHGILQAQVAKEKLRQDKAISAAKKKEGVSIGMTPEDVLASSWGKPERINRTITANAVQEQWVYGSRSYLYFRNGILTTVQN